MDYFYPHQSFKTPSPEKQQNTELPFPWQRLGKRWGGGWRDICFPKLTGKKGKRQAGGASDPGDLGPCDADETCEKAEHHVW